MCYVYMYIYSEVFLPQVIKRGINISYLACFPILLSVNLIHVNSINENKILFKLKSATARMK